MKRLFPFVLALAVGCGGAAPAGAPVSTPASRAPVSSASQLAPSTPAQPAPPPEHASKTPLAEVVRPFPIEALLKNLAVDRPRASRTLVVGAGSPELVKALVQRGHVLDIVEKDDARYADAEAATRTSFFRCASMPKGLLRADALPSVTPCRDPERPYDVIVVDCSRQASPLACATSVVDPSSLKPAAAIYIFAPVEHHLGVRAPFKASLTMRTETGFDVLGVPEVMPWREVPGSSWSMREQPFPGPDDHDADRGHYLGCVISANQQRIMPFDRREPGTEPYSVVPDVSQWNRTPLTHTSRLDATMLRDELLVPANLGPQCYALWGFDAQIESRQKGAPYYVFQGLRQEVWPYRMKEIVSAYTPHVTEATHALGRGDLPAAIAALREASAVLDGGLGPLAPHTVRGLLVKELTHELTWALGHGRPADFARAVYRFQPHVKRLESFPAELALLRAADAYALSVLKTPDSAAVKVARHYARTLFEKPAEADAPSPLPAAYEWLDGAGEY